MPPVIDDKRVIFQREKALLDSIARALSTDRVLAANERINLLLKAVFELDGIEAGRIVPGLARDRLVCTKDEAFHQLLIVLKDTMNTDDETVQATRLVLTEVDASTRALWLNTENEKLFIAIIPT